MTVTASTGDDIDCLPSRDDNDNPLVDLLLFGDLSPPVKLDILGILAIDLDDSTFLILLLSMMQFTLDFLLDKLDFDLKNEKNDIIFPTMTN